MNRIYVALLAVVFATQASVMARAEERIMMYADNLGPDHGFIQNRMGGG